MSKYKRILDDLTSDKVFKILEKKTPTSDFVKEFTERLTSFNQQRISEDIIPQKRRLDSLARIINGKGECASVCFDGEKIIIGSNFGNFREKKSTETLADYKRDYRLERIEIVKSTNDLIKRVMDYLYDIANNNFMDDQLKLESEKEVVFESCKRALSKILKSEDTLKEIIDALYKSYNKTLFDDCIVIAQAARKRDYGPLEKLLGSIGLKAELKTETAETLLQAIRTITDLKKISRSITRENPEKRFPEELIKAFKSKPDDGYHIIQPYSEPITKEEIFVHAEMKVLDHLIKTRKIEERRDFYFGISKLCCVHCITAMKTCNINQDREKEVARGNHTVLCMWRFPDSFLEREDYMRAFFGEKLYDEFKLLSSAEQEKAIAAIEGINLARKNFSKLGITLSKIEFEQPADISASRPTGSMMTSNILAGRKRSFSNASVKSTSSAGPAPGPAPMEL